MLLWNKELGIVFFQINCLVCFFLDFISFFPGLGSFINNCAFNISTFRAMPIDYVHGECAL